MKKTPSNLTYENQYNYVLTWSAVINPIIVGLKMKPIAMVVIDIPRMRLAYGAAKSAGKTLKQIESMWSEISELGKLVTGQSAICALTRKMFRQN